MPRRLVDSRGLAPLRGALAARSAPWTPPPATTSGRQSSPLSVLDYHAEMPAGASGARAHLSIRHGVERAEPAARVPIVCCAHPITRPVPTRLEGHSPAAGSLTYGRFQPARNPRHQLFSPPHDAASSRRFASKKLPARVLRCRCGPAGFARSGRAHHGPPSQGNGPRRQQKETGK